MDVENIIQKIIDNGKIEDMHILSDILEDTMEELQKYDKDCYKKYEMKLYKMAYGSVLTQEMAEKIVSNMKPYHMYFNPSEAREIQDKYGFTDIRPTDFFIVINSAYNDYKNVFGDNLEMYVKYTVAFINDEDAKNDKVFLYFTEIPK